MARAATPVVGGGAPGELTELVAGPGERAGEVDVADEPDPPLTDGRLESAVATAIPAPDLAFRSPLPQPVATTVTNDASAASQKGAVRRIPVSQINARDYFKLFAASSIGVSCSRDARRQEVAASGRPAACSVRDRATATDSART